MNPEEQSNLRQDEAERLTEEILDVILSLSALDFSKKIEVGYEDSNFNAVAVGLNMLGQELERSVISKQALEEEVDKRTKELRVREQKYRNIFESTSISIWEQDVSKLVYAVDALRSDGIKDIKKFLSQNPGWIFKTLEWVSIVDVNRASVSMFEAKDKKELLSRFQELLKEETLKSFESVVVGLWNGKREFDFETVMWTLSGHRLNVMIQIRIPPKGAPNNNTLMSIVNLTGQRELEEQLRQSQKMEAVGRLAGGVAHDFNNLLTVMLNYGQMLQEELKPTDSMRKQVDAIVECSERASALTQQLLAFSRKQVITPKVLNLNDILTKLHKMLERLLGENVLLINKVSPEVSMLIKADANQVEQIVMNLAINACDAMGSGGKLILETSEVEVDALHSRDHSELEPGHYVMLVVSDTGCGMPLDVQKRIFEPFYTTKGVGQGTGLGLSTVYGNMKQNQGTITVYSEEGHGTTFKLYFPKINKDENIEASASSNEHETTGGSETILLVEDEERVRTVARTLLAKYGYKVLEACNGGEALLICEQEKGRIDIMLTDVIMPNMNGKQLAERLKTIKPDMKVVFMSGYTDNVITENGVLAEGESFIQKPFTSNSLLKLLREKLDS